MSCAVNMGAITSMLQASQAGGGGGGGNGMAQMWLASWLPVLDGKRFNAIQEICNFDKPLVRAQDVHLIPKVFPGFESIPFIKALMEALSMMGSNIENFAELLEDFPLDQLNIQPSEIDTNFMAMVGQLSSLKNVAMAQAITNDYGIV